MAQKKLLLSIILLLLCSDIALGNEEFRFKKEDLEFANELTTKSRQMTFGEMQAKWLDLQNMLGSINKENRQGNKMPADFDSNKDSDWGISFRIFVSSSMSKNLLKRYAVTAKQYGGVLVFNGLPLGSWRKLSELVSEISGDKPELVAMQIDDEAFSQFNITEVPSFVLSKQEDMFAENPEVTFDKVTGSIGIKRALEIFEEKGQLQDIAAHLLKQGPVDE